MRRAFQLAEIIIAVTLLAGIGSALMGVWVTHARAVDQAENLLAATHIAQSKLVEQMGQGFQAVSGVGNTTLERSIDASTTQFTYHWTVTVHDTTVDSPNVKEVEVKVEWLENNQAKSIEMETSVYWQG